MTHELFFILQNQHFANCYPTFILQLQACYYYCNLLSIHLHLCEFDSHCVTFYKKTSQKLNF